MRVPNAENAEVGQGKVCLYLLNLAHPVGGAKAKFFLLFGFQIGAWAVLADGLRSVVANNEVVEVRTTGYGNSYRVCGELLAPDGRRPRVVTIWQVDVGSEVPRLVTAYPEDSI